MNRAIIAVVVVVVAGLSAGIAAGKVIYVDGGASGADNGTCWADAYEFLQDALTDANDAEKPVEIRVAQGIYRPDRSAAEPNGTGDFTASFALIRGVALRGGYAGVGEADPNDRDIELYETVVSGDLDGNDVDVNDPADMQDEPSRAENAYHVVTGGGTAESAVLDGFTITGGNANGGWSASLPYEYSGGGMYNEGFPAGTKRGEPGETIEYAATISNCTFVANSATNGGGMYNYGCNPKISDCSFLGNSAALFCSGHVCDGGKGGGMCNEQSSPMLTGCVFSGNSAPRGGGMFNDESDPVVSLCTFVSNWADSEGGGIYNDWSSPTINGCFFSNNSAESSGGGMANHQGSPLVEDCMFSENCTGIGGGIYNTQSSATIIRCIFTGNSCNGWGGAISNYAGDVVLTRCVFAGNRARRYGGAVRNSHCQAIMTNCTIIQNRAGEPGGGVSCRNESEGLLTHSILWGNSAPKGAQIAVDGSDSEPATITVEYSAVMGGEEGVYVVEPNDRLDWGAGNMDSEPWFAAIGYWDPNGTPEDGNDDFWVMGDYHLKSQGGRWEPATQAWIIDEVTSPSIDAGDPMSAIGPEPFPNGGIINMGAYGGTTEASKSWFGGPVCEVIVAGDINGDCKVNFLDFRLMALHWIEEH